MSQGFDAVLEARFRQCPGHRKIKRKEYSLRSNTHRKGIERTVDFRRCFFPGLHIEMSMIFVGIFLSAKVYQRCTSEEYHQELKFSLEVEGEEDYPENFRRVVLLYCRDVERIRKKESHDLSSLTRADLRNPALGLDFKASQSHSTWADLQDQIDVQSSHPTPGTWTDQSHEVITMS